LRGTGARFAWKESTPAGRDDSGFTRSKGCIVELALNLDPGRLLASEEPILAGLAASGDDRAFEQLRALHASRLLRQARALCDDPDLADDLLQETFIEAWRSLPRYNGRCRFFTWLCSILIHRHQNSRRKRRPLPFSFVTAADQERIDGFLEALPDPGPLPGTDTERAEKASRVLRSLDTLPAKQRAVVYLRFYAEESLEGIADALGCSVGTVKSRLFHGLERLRRMKAMAEENTP
jgi:RNA polymerase sigma-70 factor (ECF subfamily)